MRPVWNWGTSSVELLWCWNVFWNWGNLQNFWNCCEWTVVILKWSDRLLRSSEKKNKQKVLGGRSRKPEIIFWPKTLIFYQKDVLFLIGAASSKPLWVPYCHSLLCFFLDGIFTTHWENNNPACFMLSPVVVSYPPLSCLASIHGKQSGSWYCLIQHLFFGAEKHIKPLLIMLQTLKIGHMLNISKYD